MARIVLIPFHYSTDGLNSFEAVPGAVPSPDVPAELIEGLVKEGFLGDDESELVEVPAAVEEAPIEAADPVTPEATAGAGTGAAPVVTE